MNILTNYCQVIEPCAHCGSHEQMTERKETTVGTRYTTFCTRCGLAKNSYEYTITNTPAPWTVHRME